MAGTRSARWSHVSYVFPNVLADVNAGGEKVFIII